MPPNRLRTATRTPFEAMAFAHYGGGSQRGGLPTWEQHTEYPPCPSCGGAMEFVAQLEWADIRPDAVGTFYAFLHRDCGVSATLYQTD